MRIFDRLSPNFDERQGAPIDMLILHYTDMLSAEEALARLCDPGAKVSSHYLIDEEGKIYRLVPEEYRAWHAGKSFWAGQSDINARSIGIELANPGHSNGYLPFPDVQITALIELCQEILLRHDIPAKRVLGHSDVAPARKIDPGELFDWPRLAGKKIGYFPIVTPGNYSEAEFFRFLYAFGYDPSCSKEDLLMAFCRHYRPSSLVKIYETELGCLAANLIDGASAIT